MEIRLEPEVMAWALAHGGAPWLRQVIEMLHQLADDPAVARLLARVWEAQSSPDS